MMDGITTPPLRGTPSPSGHALLLASQGWPSRCIVLHSSAARTSELRVCRSSASPSLQISYHREHKLWDLCMERVSFYNSWEWKREEYGLLFPHERVTRLTFSKALLPAPRRSARSASPMDKDTQLGNKIGSSSYRTSQFIRSFTSGSLATSILWFR